MQNRRLPIESTKGSDSPRLEIKFLQPGDTSKWDAYVASHPVGALYHLSGWREVIEKAYGHHASYLMATRRVQPNGTGEPIEDIVGVLPLIHLKHFLFGNALVSMPFFDLGGALADDGETENALLSEAINLGRELKAKSIELRHTSLQTSQQPETEDSFRRRLSLMSYELSALSCVTRSHKVRMLLELPDSPELLMKSFKSKLRSQIKKPMKEGLTAKIGGVELLDDFYRVFAENMRDLGSPVHSKYLIRAVFEIFPENARITVVYKDEKPTACSVFIGFKDVLENPWASSLRKYSRLSPNMLLYWTMLEYACENSFKYFDFGRSSPDEGTYKFKNQWGAKPEPLHWHYFSLNGKRLKGESDDKARFDKAIRYWQRLPVPVTKIVGPMIRKHISL